MRQGWSKSGAEEQDVKMAVYECERDMRMAQQGPPFFKRCMQAKGFSKAD